MKHLPEAVPAKSKDPTENRFFRFKESAMKCLFFLSALTSIAAVLAICAFLFAGGRPGMRESVLCSS